MNRRARVPGVLVASLSLVLVVGVVGTHAAPATIADGAEDRILLTGRVVLPSGAITGEVLVVGNTIACAAASCSSESDAIGATLITTHGTIYPGMLDAHNHALFNLFDEHDWTPTKKYKNHNQWTSEARYKEVMAAKKFLEDPKGGNVRCEMDKYGEVKALIAGTTSVLVAAGTSDLACFGSVARTIDTARNDLGQGDTIQTSISVPSATAATNVCKAVKAGTTKAYVIHVGEGVDETARKEFDRLSALNSGCLLSAHTTIIHGTAFGAPEFATMAQHGMALVWSPKSNAFLYTDADRSPVTRIDLALTAGVDPIALGPDWGLGGSINQLDELRFADGADAQYFGNVLTPERLFRMVTIDAARALGVDDLLGSLAKKKRADLFVVASDNADAFEALLKATPATVRLVIVDGRVLYGDANLEAAGPSVPGCETLDVCGASKFLCVAEDSSKDKLGQTFAQIAKTLGDKVKAYDKSHSASKPLAPLAPLAVCAP